MREQVKLGELPDGDTARRDAIHIAVAPVIAAETLKPGQHVGFVDAERTKVGAAGKPLIGIVDPFLEHDVYEGLHVWLCLYPHTVTSLRHEWTHPAFGPEPAAGDDAEKRFSEMYLRVYARRMNCYDDPETAFLNLIRGLQSGELLAHGSDLHGLYELDRADELKQHAERYLGITINWGTFTFGCSC